MKTRIEEIKNLTPLEAFSALKHMPLPFIFTGGPDRRYSFASADPFAVVKALPRGTVIERIGKKREPFDGDVFSAITELFSGTAASAEVGKERLPFTGGAAGYFSYNLRHGAKSSKDELIMPDSVVGLYGAVYVFDNVENKSFVACADDSRFLSAFQKIKTALTNGGNRHNLGNIPLQKATTGFVSNTTRDEYIRAVKIAQEYIKDGDIYQINISHRLKIQWQGDPLSLFAWLVKNRPLPFSAFMDMGDFQIISNSPERLLKTVGDHAETSPIKGTRPRGRTTEEDKRFIWALKNSVKERAEHVMIVDLERSDLGAVSAPGSVKVTKFEAVKTFPGLHHMVSTISSTLESSSLECLRAIFPGGSVTGAPKIRAMEIIDELENAPRGLYTGCLGWVDFSGDMDMAMAIRTAVYKDGALYLSVGSGIVADSNPEEEYDETILKAKDFFDAIIEK